MAELSEVFWHESVFSKMFESCSGGTKFFSCVSAFSGRVHHPLDAIWMRQSARHILHKVKELSIGKIRLFRRFDDFLEESFQNLRFVHLKHRSYHLVGLLARRRPPSIP